MAEEIPSSAQAQFVDPYQYVSPGKVSISGWDSFADFFNGDANRRQVEQNKARYEQDIERQKTNSARAWEEWFDSTAVQRRVKDIEKAGLNPWLALQSGGINSNGSSSVGSQNSGKSISSHDKDSGSDFFKFITTALMVLKVLL